MHSDYSDSQIEFAHRLLNQREQLEQEEVEQWLAKPEHRALLDELARIKQGLEKREYTALQIKEWKSLQKQIRKIRLRTARWWMSAAALLVLGVGIGLWTGYSEEDGLAFVDQKEHRDEIVPGKEQARLILADGREVALGKKNTSIEVGQPVRIINDSVEGLKYSQLTGQQAEEVVVEYNTLEVPVGGFYKLELPDGSKVCLNAASELKFPVRFAGKKREVYLKGEGYFEVTKDTDRPFVVHLNKADVTVLGTAFNINAYEEENHIYTTLAEGAVAFYSHQRAKQLILQPGMQSDMDLKTGETILGEVDPSVYMAWTEGRFIFQSITLEAMMRQLQRWYDFEVFYCKQELKNYKFRGRLDRDMGIQEALGIIEETTDVRFQINGKTIVVR